MRARKLIWKITAGAALAAGLAVPSSAAADTFTVTNGNADGPGSLRQAVADSEAHSGHDEINFAADVHTIVLALGQQANPLRITGDLSINGPGADKLEVLGPSGRGFELAGSANVTISGMTIDKFSAFATPDTGGAVLNAGSLVLDGVVLQETRVESPPGGRAEGGGIANSGTLTIKNSTLSKDRAIARGGGEAVGGAVFNSGTMTLDHTTLSDNSTAGANSTPTEGGDAMGAGIANTGDLTVVDSTLSQNRAQGGTGYQQGGAGRGGGIYNFDGGKLTIRGTTLAENQARGGSAFIGPTGIVGFALGGAIENVGSSTFQIENSTITANQAFVRGNHEETQSVGGGIDNQASPQAGSSVLATTIQGNVAFEGANISNAASNLSLQDSILADPIKPDQTAGQNCGHPGGVSSAFIQSLGYNLDSDGSCELKKTGDQANKDPQLKALADNGGPTQTMAIPLSSPALDQGVSGGLTTDQRGERRPVIVPGVPRPQGGDGSDIGAYEYQPGPAGHSRIKGSVRPGRTHARERTCFKFKAKRATGGPMANAQVKMGGKRARTDEHGKATICKKFKQSAVRHPRIRKRGHERAKLRVNVRR